MMEEDQEQRFACKFCYKTFVNGKSLGGHMRGHLALISARKAQDNDNGNIGFPGYGLRQSHKKALKVTEQSDEEEEEEMKNNASIGSEDGYGLRENPKKSWRASGSKPNVMVKENLNVCKECGKGFPSMRALSGHMRCHSIKAKEENICKKCGKGFDSIRALFGHMRSHSKRSGDSIESTEIEIKSDYEPPFAIPKKRLRTRYQITSNPSSSSNLNGSSSSVVTDTNEAEEVAMCLMMLSRGVQNWDDFNSVNNNSNNDSVILEAQSSLKIWDCDDGEQKEKEEAMNKLDSCTSGPTNALLIKNLSEFCLLDSGSAIGDENKTEFGVSVNDSLSCDKFNNPTQDAEFLAGFACDIGSNHVNLGLMKLNPSDEPKFNCDNLDLGENSFEIFLNNSENKGEFKTTISSIREKLLLSNIGVEKRLGFNEKLVDEEGSEVKNKEHECSICFKVFASGQALGGHKRAHYTGLADQNRAKEVTLINEELPAASIRHNMFDLNVPLSLEDGSATDVGFKPWWVRGDCEYEPMVIYN